MSKSGSSFRLASALPFAAVATIVIFFVMSGLIQNDVETRPPEPRPDIDIFMDEQKPPPPQPPLTPPDKLPPPPPPPDDSWKETGDPNPIIVPPPTPTGPPPITQGSNNGGALVRFPPQYPASCQGRGQEGTAVVAYDVTASGQVVNARIVSSSHPCFNREAIRTIERWKYGPTGKGGNQVVQSNLRQTFRFRLVE